MGTVYRTTRTEPMPEGAEIITRKGQPLARWETKRGKAKTAPVNGEGRVVITAATYTARYREASGITRWKGTRCKDKTAGLAVLARLERRTEFVRAGVMTRAEDAVTDHQPVPLAEQFAAYITKLESDGTSPTHRQNVERCLKRVAAGCNFERLADFNREVFEKWLVQRRRLTRRPASW